MLAKDTFLQTKDKFGCLVRFKHKKHVVRVRKTSSGFKQIQMLKRRLQQWSHLAIMLSASQHESQPW